MSQARDPSPARMRHHPGLKLVEADQASMESHIGGNRCLGERKGCRQVGQGASDRGCAQALALNDVRRGELSAMQPNTGSCRDRAFGRDSDVNGVARQEVEPVEPSGAAAGEDGLWRQATCRRLEKLQRVRRCPCQLVRLGPDAPPHRAAEVVARQTCAARFVEGEWTFGQLLRDEGVPGHACRITGSRGGRQQCLLRPLIPPGFQKRAAVDPVQGPVFRKTGPSGHFCAPVSGKGAELRGSVGSGRARVCEPRVPHERGRERRAGRAAGRGFELRRGQLVHRHPGG